MTKDNTPLEQLKELQKKQEKLLLVKTLTYLKEQAKKVLKCKALINESLKQLNVKDEDSKAIIDWINSLNDVKLSEDDDIDIEDEVKEMLKDKKKKVENEITKINNYQDSIYTVNTPLSWTATSGTLTNCSV